MQWIARDSNGKLIRQFENGIEHFQSELNRKIISVGYYDEVKDEYYLCSLISGIFYFPDRKVETVKDIGGREFVLERRHSVVGSEHKIQYIFGFVKNGKRYEANTEGKEVKII